MEVQAVHAQLLRDFDLAAGQFVGREDAVDRPETPADGGTQHDALAIQAEHRVFAHAARFEPAETETAGSPVGNGAAACEADLADVQVGIIDAPQPHVGGIDDHLHLVRPALQFATEGLGEDDFVRIAPVVNLDLDVAGLRASGGVLDADERVRNTHLRGVLHVDVGHVHGGQHFHPDALGDAAETMVGGQHLAVPGDGRRIAPVQVAAGIGDADCEFHFFARTDEIRDVRHEGCIGNDLVVSQFSIDEHFAPGTQRSEAQDDPVSFFKGRGLEAAGPPGDADDVCIRAGLYGQVFLGGAGHVDRQGLAGSQYIPAGRRAGLGKRKGFLVSQFRAFFAPGGVFVLPEVPALAGEFSALAVLGRRIRRAGQRENQ